MNREIKFKYIFQHDDTGRIVTKVFGIEDVENALNNDDYRLYGVVARCQLTGLKDKNGKEIYEGDIVKMGTDKDMKFYISVIVYEAPEFLCKNGKNLNTLFRNWEYGYEVIGNIHENPELLK